MDLEPTMRLSSSFWPQALATPLVSAALYLRPQKNQPSLAGFRYLRLSSAHLNRSFPSATLVLARLAPFCCLFNLQVASNPA
jgi:hypothetical protein